MHRIYGTNFCQQVCFPETLSNEFCNDGLCFRNSFATLLTSGDLSSKNSVKCAISDSFQIILAKICFYAHFTIVERVESSASLYCQAIQEQPLCLLVKQQVGNARVLGGGVIF